MIVNPLVSNNWPCNYQAQYASDAMQMAHYKLTIIIIIIIIIINTP